MADEKPLALDVAAALAGTPYAATLSADGGLVVATGTPPRALFATPAALLWVGAHSLGELEASLLTADSPGARRLRRLAQSLPLDGAPRLEQLRFYAAPGAVSIRVLSGRILGATGEPWILLAEPPNAADVPAAPVAAPVARSGPARFLWSLDEMGRFGSIDPVVVQRLGELAPKEAETLEAFSARSRFAAVWAEAVAKRDTFSALRLPWPQPGVGAAEVVKLSGSPVFERGQAFAGFRGFGVFTGETVEAGLPDPTGADLRIDPVAAAPAVSSPNPETSLGPISAPSREGEATGFKAMGASNDEAAPGPGTGSVLRGGAEIFMLRPPAGAPSKVVPIRPGALGVLTSTFDDDDPTHANDSVELSSRERDAFREIARALGVKSRDTDEAAQESEPEVDHESASGLVEALPIGALVLRDGEALYANRAFLDCAGFDSLAAFQHGDGLNRMFRGRDPVALAAEGEDVTIVGPEGDLAMAHAHAQAIVWAGAPATLLSLRRSRDLEHLRHARALDADLRRHAQRASNLVRALDVACDGFVHLDAQGCIVEISPRAEAVFGYASSEVEGQSFLLLLAPTAQAAAQAAFFEALQSEASSEPVRLEASARAHAGRSFPARFSFGRLDASDGVSGFFIVEDREAAGAAERERAKALEAVKRANERKIEFLAAVSHEIRTPMHAILGFAEVMIEERFGPIGNERYKDYLKDIHASGAHIVSLANDLIDLAKIESGKLELEFTPVDVNQIVRDCVSIMQPQASRERIIVRMSLSEKLPNVMVDQRSLRQIMLNLMSNAVKYNEPGGQVIVSTAADEAGHTVIRVRDTGVGMTDAELGVAMEPFKRAGAKNGEGSGLGLPLTKALVEANRGDFSIKSRKDQGTLVEVAFANIQAAQ